MTSRKAHKSKGGERFDAGGMDTCILEYFCVLVHGDVSAYEVQVLAQLDPRIVLYTHFLIFVPTLA